MTGPSEFSSSGLTAVVEEALADLAPKLPDLVPRDEVLVHCRFLALLASIDGVFDAKESSARAAAHVEEATRAVNRAQALRMKAESELRDVLAVIDDSRVTEDPAYEKLHQAILAVLATTRH